MRIHQSSVNYGVNSRALSPESIDQTGPNQGFYPRATGVEVCSYFQSVLDEVLLPSGRVRFFGLCDYVGDWAGAHSFTSRVTGEHTTVRVRRRIVDATYLQVSVPATHEPAFTVDPGARFVPVGELVRLVERPGGYTVLGGGKTAMDACVWLLENGEQPDRIRWIRPRDAWLMDRAHFQPLDLVTGMVEGFSLGIEAIAQAETLEDLWRRVEGAGQLHRLDAGVAPTMFRGAISSAAERSSLARIEGIVRLGHVRHVGTDRIVLAEGEIPTDDDQLHVDCTAAGFRTAPTRPIFEPGRIVIQSLMGGHTTYNAALIGFVESTGRDDAEKNRLCPPVAQANVPADWIRMMRGLIQTTALHAAEPDIAAWQGQSRLNLTGAAPAHLGEPRMQEALARWQTHHEYALRNAGRLLGEQQSPH